MGLEIERKFLVRNESWRTVNGTLFRQGYLSSNLHRVVRVRTMGEKAVLTVKGLNSGPVRREFEYAIPLADANAMLDDLCERPLIEKTRYRIKFAEHIWEVDEFFGDNAGLLVAEIELQAEDEFFEKPSWVGDEVTNDPRYFNSNLVLRPYKTW